MFTRAGQALLVAAGLLAGMAAAAAAEQSPIQFWLQQSQALPKGEPQRAHHPVFRPRPPRPVLQSERRAPPPPMQAAPVSKPGFVVAVFGDSFGFDAARGLNEVYAAVPRAGVADETNETASLAGLTLPAWNDGLNAAIKEAGRVDAAVVMLGTADLRPMTDDHGTTIASDTPAWRQLYAERVLQTATVFRDRKIPLVWVGLPVVRDDDLARRYAGLNAIVRENAAAAGLSYVDSWAAFADENGHFSATGPDENGQDAKLRRDDGRRFTRAGAHKLASFIEPELKRIQDRVSASAKLATIGRTDAEVFDQALAIDVNAQIRREAGLPPLPDPRENKDGPVVELTAAPSAPDGRLANPDTKVALTATADAVLSSGFTPPPRRGRADDFSWPPPSP